MAGLNDMLGMPQGADPMAQGPPADPMAQGPPMPPQQGLAPPESGAPGEQEVAATPQEEALMERAITALEEAIYKNDKFFESVKTKLEKADPLDERMAGIVLSLMQRMDAEMKKQLQIHAGIEFFMQLATVAIEELIDIAEALGRQEVAEPDFHERVMMILLQQHGQQFEGVPEAQTMAMENMQAMMADGTAEQAAALIQQREQMGQGQNPIAAGVSQGLGVPNA